MLNCPPSPAPSVLLLLAADDQASPDWNGLSAALLVGAGGAFLPSSWYGLLRLFQTLYGREFLVRPSPYLVRPSECVPGFSISGSLV